MLIKIVSPASIALLLLLIDDYLWGLQFVVIYAVVIIPFNIKKLKHGILLTVLLSMVMCFLVLLFSMGITSGLWYLISEILPLGIKSNSQFLNISANDFSALIAIGIISPILMFYGYRFIFKWERTRNSKYFLIIPIVILMCFGFSGVFMDNDKVIPFYWQLIMLVITQLTFYQKELIFLIKKAD
ncbi:hypothetical protein BST92_06165 [Nonlabens arenilitoris]|uniref:Uncharacterized protein n=1 Tax=Nonlabens arenilitoris TaxID=1217969 RepID=A0A2S7UAU6_9FLAO|nr:hypothetical protein [Nonlabens arenilitoris]PQJ31534.1 hypothetical protein BST92_06165 [Nonlabens arenilitoris]